jgi:Holliday junction resolvase RusA-like endonuclease
MEVYMTKGKKLKEDAEYDEKYGHIPNDQLGIVAWILGKKADNEKIQEDIKKQANKIKSIKWNKCEFTMWKLIKPSQRPRFANHGGYIQAYVPGAKNNGAWFEQFFWENDLPFIETPCIIDITVYERTPSAFRMKEAVLAELGYIRPWKRTGDVDNYSKGLLDMIQHGMLADDCLVIEHTLVRRYSQKPHADVKIRYMDKWPDDLPEHVTGLARLKTQNKMGGFND